MLNTTSESLNKIRQFYLKQNNLDKEVSNMNTGVLKDVGLNSDELQGVLVITRTRRDGTQEKEVIKNLVVAKAREVVRDLVFGDSATITALALGNANIPSDKALSKANIPDPTISETVLVNKTYEAPITNKQKLVYENRPAIKYTFFMDFNEGNGVGDNTYYCEAGLTLANATIFTRLTFVALVKDKNSSLTLEYFLLF